MDGLRLFSKTDEPTVLLIHTMMCESTRCLHLLIIILLYERLSGTETGVKHFERFSYMLNIKIWWIWIWMEENFFTRLCSVTY